eukprot:CAMPEP_0175160980 /NCGR_PEP_ID=MMETSP0087-20121206/24346_1 /TAXON_ID=136419 /ORGANISM="Unknown Unknown, Strain D1" /LENGTH=104 /DNA_ID=CAMNT_0016449335 /DNA_START=211 /DNA_END=525 /DNA_ORIENTATION=-
MPGSFSNSPSATSKAPTKYLHSWSDNFIPEGGGVAVMAVEGQVDEVDHCCAERVYLPSLTPSGLSIGMTLKTNLSLSSRARGSWVSVMKARKPFIIREELVSPG